MSLACCQHTGGMRTAREWTTLGQSGAIWSNLLRAGIKQGWYSLTKCDTESV